MATRPVRPLVTKPGLLVFKEKHGERYFHIPDEATLIKAAIYVLTERFNEDWYHDPSKEEDEIPKAPDFTKEQVEAMPISLRPAASRALLDYTRELREYNYALDEYTRIQKAVQEKNGREAWGILSDRSDHEYEHVQFEHYENVEEV